MIGFDYGTSNCAVGSMVNGAPEILPLNGTNKFISSTLYAPDRDIISHWLFNHLPEGAQKLFKEQRGVALQKGQRVKRELIEDGIETHLLFGQQALEQYLIDPEEGYYIKSPKSFLGVSGLHQNQIDFFEDVVAAMMLNVKQQAEKYLKQEVTQTVIGRPINFQGLKGEESNKQAINVLTKAAKRIGYKDVEFQYEPVAAGFEFEASLTKETRVLVVDIGGGTSDCSMLLMGGDHALEQDRKSDFLSHTGVRVGGNDFDIGLALKGIMPSLGANTCYKSGKVLPVAPYHQAVAINNLSEQTEFYSAANGRYLTELIRDAKEPKLIERLIQVYQQKLSYQLVNGAEQSKIALSNTEETLLTLDGFDTALTVPFSRQLMLSANQRLLDNIASLMKSAIEQAGCQPDVVFVTGGTAKSPVLSHFLQAQSPNVPIIVGDHFGSVTSGLTRWAHKIFT